MLSKIIVSKQKHEFIIFIIFFSNNKHLIASDVFKDKVIFSESQESLKGVAHILVLSFTHLPSLKYICLLFCGLTML